MVAKDEWAARHVSITVGECPCTSSTDRTSDTFLGYLPADGVSFDTGQKLEVGGNISIAAARRWLDTT